MGFYIVATEKTRGLGVGVKRRFLDRRVHTNPVPGPQKPLLGGHAGICRHHLALAGGVCWQDERVVAVLEDMDGEIICKSF